MVPIDIGIAWCLISDQGSLRGCGRAGVPDGCLQVVCESYEGAGCAPVGPSGGHPLSRNEQ
jgi:hypothetical protein